MANSTIKKARNPNSPAAIQARLNNQPDPTPYEQVQFIGDLSDNECHPGRILIDLTQSDVNQRVGYVLTGGPRSGNRRFVRSVASRDVKTGQPIVTNYFIDTDRKQWIIIRDFVNGMLPSSQLPEGTSSAPYPRATIGGFFGGIYSSAPGETWRNQGRSVDEIKARQRKIHKGPTIDPDANRDIEQVRDHFHDDFTGEQ